MRRLARTLTNVWVAPPLRARKATRKLPHTWHAGVEQKMLLDDVTYAYDDVTYTYDDVAGGNYARIAEQGSVIVSVDSVSMGSVRN